MSFENSEDWEAHLKMCTKAKTLVTEDPKPIEDVKVIMKKKEGMVIKVKEKENEESDIKKEISVTELVNDDLSLVKKSYAWTEAQVLVKNTEKEETGNEKTYKTVKLNYILNELKNMKVAKANLGDL